MRSPPLVKLFKCTTSAGAERCVRRKTRGAPPGRWALRAGAAEKNVSIGLQRSGPVLAGQISLPAGRRRSIQRKRAC